MGVSWVYVYVVGIVGVVSLRIIGSDADFFWWLELVFCYGWGDGAREVAFVLRTFFAGMTDSNKASLRVLGVWSLYL